MKNVSQNKNARVGKGRPENQPIPMVPVETPRGQFLASHPERARVVAASIAEIVKRMSAMRDNFRPVVISFFDRNRTELWQIGVFINEFIDDLPGKQLTPDFYEQHRGQFVDEHGQRISLETLNWLAGIARRFPKEAPGTFELLQIWKQLPMQLFDQEEFRLEAPRPPQQLHAPANPLNLLKEQFSFPKLNGLLKQLRADANYCPTGRLRPDLAETLRVELEPTFKLVDELREELGL